MPTLEETRSAITARLSMEILRPINVFVGLTTSGSFLYPIQGVLYFFQNPALWPLFLKMLPPTAIIYITVYMSVFAALFPMNVSVSMMCCGPPGFFIGSGITFQEINYISNYILSNHLIPYPMINLFDIVLCTEGLDKVVFPGKLKRVVEPTFGETVVESFIWIPLTLPLYVLSFLRFVIVSTIPVVGPFILTLNNFTARGNKSQSRFYRLRKFRKRQIRYLVKEREGEYMGFGVACDVLESIPFLGFFFHFTNQIGAALMAVDYYKKGRVNF